MSDVILDLYCVCKFWPGSRISSINQFTFHVSSEERKRPFGKKWKYKVNRCGQKIRLYLWEMLRNGTSVIETGNLLGQKTDQSELYPPKTFLILCGNLLNLWSSTIWTIFSCVGVYFFFLSKRGYFSAIIFSCNISISSWKRKLFFVIYVSIYCDFAWKTYWKIYPTEWNWWKNMIYCKWNVFFQTILKIIKILFHRLFGARFFLTNATQLLCERILFF